MIDQTLQEPTETAPPPDLPSHLDVLLSRVRSAECAAANLERALVSSRRIGMALGILMYQHRLTDEQAFALLRRHSQHHHVKVRDLAETVIFTGTL